MESMKDMQKQRRKKGITYFFICLGISFLFSLVYLGISNTSLGRVWPNWSDEFFYYKQIEALTTYGRPLGYFGYDGSYAELGTYGAHSFFILIPYAIVQALSNNAYCGLAITNHLLFGFALWYLHKKTHISLINLIVISFVYFTPLVAYYMNTDMVEGLSYSIAISAAVLLHASNNTKNTSVLGILYIILVPLFKITWLVLVPIILLNICKKNKWKKTVLITSVIGIIEYIILRFTSCKYFSGVYAIEQLKIELHDGFQGVDRYIKSIWMGNIKNTFRYAPNMIGVTSVLIIIILIISMVYMLHGFYKKKSGCWIPFYVLVGYIVGTTFLYSGGPTAVRTISQASIFSLVYILLDSEWMGYYFVITFCVLSVGLTCYMQKKGIYDARYYYDKHDKITIEEYKEFTSQIELDKQKDPWDNTIAIGMNNFGTPYELFFPSGIGINYYWQLDECVELRQTGYLFFNKTEIELIDKARKNGYIEMSTNENYMIMRKQNEN